MFQKIHICWWLEKKVAHFEMIFVRILVQGVHLVLYARIMLSAFEISYMLIMYVASKREPHYNNIESGVS